MPARPKVTATKAPRTPAAKPKPTAKPPSKRTSQNRSVQGTGFGSSMLNAGVQLGTASIAAKAAQDTLDKLTQNPLLLAAVAGVAVLFLLK